MRLHAVILPCFSFQKPPISFHSPHFKLLKISPTFLILLINLLNLLFIKHLTHKGG